MLIKNNKPRIILSINMKNNYKIKLFKKSQKDSIKVCPHHNLFYIKNHSLLLIVLNFKKMLFFIFFN